MHPRAQLEKKNSVVGDEQPMRYMLKQALERNGDTVFTAACAEEAMAVMGRENCPILLLDLHLPETDGIRLYELIKAKHPDSIAFLLTGWIPEEDLLACHAAGFRQHFTKPVSLNVLYDSLQLAFENRPALDQQPADRSI